MTTSNYFLNDAWQEFLANPVAYRSWEEAEIADLAARLLRILSLFSPSLRGTGSIRQYVFNVLRSL